MDFALGGLAFRQLLEHQPRIAQLPRFGERLSQQHLRQVLGNLGVLVMGGEAYITFKAGLIDDADTITDEGTRRFLRSFADQFTTLLARLNGRETATQAA